MKLFGKGTISWAGNKGLDFFLSKEAGWLETTIAPSSEHLSQDFNTDEYLDSADALSEEEKENLQVAKHLISTASNTVPPDTTL